MQVAVVDQNKTPLAPTTAVRARLLLKKGKAAVFRRIPFTIILKRVVDLPINPDLRLKIDPGSKKTGIAIVNQRSGQVVFAAEIEHRGQAIKNSLDARRAIRRSRRSRHTRYRKPRFLNRRRSKGWLPPSLLSRVENIKTWVNRLSRFYPISGISMELVKFDTQLMENPEISGVEYQQGELAGYEVKEYLLEKWGRRCVYCGKSDLPLQVEHIIPRSRGGSDRVSNLTLACGSCNQKKGNRTAAEFGYPNVERFTKMPLKDVAAKATGHNSRQMCRMDKYGFPRTSAKGARTVEGFRTGDLVKATVPSGKKAGIHVGQVAVRTSGSFNITNSGGRIEGISYRYCRVIQKSDGYAVTVDRASARSQILLTTKVAGFL